MKELVDEMETLKQECDRQLLHNRKRIARHRSDLQAYSAKSDEIQGIWVMLFVNLSLEVTISENANQVCVTAFIHRIMTVYSFSNHG